MHEIYPYQKLSSHEGLLLLSEAIEKVAQNRIKLILLVGTPGMGKTKIIQKLSEHLRLSIFPLGYEISKAMLEGVPSDKIPRYLRDNVKGTNSTVLLDNLEVLFASSLNLNPLTILKQLSADGVVVASFSGRVIDGNLLFAEASSSEYKNYSKYELKDLVLFELLGEEK